MSKDNSDSDSDNRDNNNSDSDCDYEEETWKCIGCGEDLGSMNPRQYCCKTYCPNEDYNNIENTKPIKKIKIDSEQIEEIKKEYENTKLEIERLKCRLLNIEQQLNNL